MACINLQIYSLKGEIPYQLPAYHLSWIRMQMLSFFSSFSCLSISAFEVLRLYPIDQYENPNLRVMLLLSVESKFNSKSFSRAWHEILLLCMSILSLRGGVSQKENCSSPLRIKIRWAFRYESSFRSHIF